MVTLVPEGLILLASVTYAAAALRMARSGALAQQLNAIESLASVDTICIDKTGTLTEPRCASSPWLPPQSVAEQELADALGRFAASSEARNLDARRDRRRASRRSPEPADEAIPFLSRRRWSGLRDRRRRATCSARPSSSRSAQLAAEASAQQEAGRRVVALRDAPRRRVPGRIPTRARRRCSRSGSSSWPRSSGRDIRETIAFLVEQGVGRQGALRRRPAHGRARSPAMPASRCTPTPIAGDALPTGDAELDGDRARRSPSSAGSRPDGKRRVVEALRQRRALRGDGRRRRQRRARAEGIAALDRPGLGDADGEGRRRRRARERRLRRDPGDGRRGPADPPQPPARDEALRHEVGVRGLPDRRGRDHAGRVPAAPATPHDRRAH